MPTIALLGTVLPVFSAAACPRIRLPILGGQTLRVALGAPMLLEGFRPW